MEAVLDALATLSRLEEGREACVLAGEPRARQHHSLAWRSCACAAAGAAGRCAGVITVSGCAGAVDTLQEAAQGDWIGDWRVRERASELLVSLTIQRDHLD